MDQVEISIHFVEFSFKDGLTVKEHFRVNFTSGNLQCDYIVADEQMNSRMIKYLKSSAEAAFKKRREKK